MKAQRAWHPRPAKPHHRVGVRLGRRRRGRPLVGNCSDPQEQRLAPSEGCRGPRLSGHQHPRNQRRQRPSEPARGLCCGRVVTFCPYGSAVFVRLMAPHVTPLSHSHLSGRLLPQRGEQSGTPGAPGDGARRSPRTPAHVAGRQGTEVDTPDSSRSLAAWLAHPSTQHSLAG